jgi:glutamine amidotransferase
VTGGPVGHVRPALIGVLDYGSGNLRSVCQALDAAGASVVLSADPEALAGCDGLVVPGVGAFATCVAGLRRVGGDRLIRAWRADKRPLLGICVGHQILFDRGVEHGVGTAGLGVLPGVVEPLTSTRLPHMGWDTVEPHVGTAMFAGLSGQRFYFVHSYAVHTPVAGATWCEHDGDRFVAAVERGALWSTQFHPEKSGWAGARLLANWLALVAGAPGKAIV